MKLNLLIATATAALLAGANAANAAGELNIYNWGNYTSPEMIEKFSKKFDIKVTVTDYDSNDAALAKIKAGAHGFDIVVPSANYVPIFISEGLLAETRPDQMENFKNVDPKWVDVAFDPGRHYTVPWQWGTTGVTVNTDLYKGDIDTAAVVFDPPEELKGKINIVPEMNDVMGLAIMYMGGEPCSADKELLKKVRDKLVEAKKSWMSMDYGTVEKFANKEYGAGINWNGASFRSRLQLPAVQFGYPKEGFVVWMDNLGVLKDAKNMDNAKLFQNFVMDPENAAMVSTFARYANGIKGSEAFMPADMKDAKEIVVPAALAEKGKFILACPKEAQDLYTKIWTDLQK